MRVASFSPVSPWLMRAGRGSSSVVRNSGGDWGKLVAAISGGAVGRVRRRSSRWGQIRRLVFSAVGSWAVWRAERDGSSVGGAFSGARRGASWREVAPLVFSRAVLGAVILCGQEQPAPLQFELHRALVAQGRVQSFAVVEDLNVFEYLVLRLSAGEEVCLVNTLLLE